MNLEPTFGEIIKNKRKYKGFSQRKLATLIGIDFTYLSKLENNRADYPPKEEVIRSLAQNLELNEEELIFLAGRIPQSDEELLRRHYQTMPALFRRIREDPSFAQKLFSQIAKTNSNYSDS